MGLIDVREVGEADQRMELIDDEVFVDSDFEETSSVRSATSITSTSSDDEAEKSLTVIRCDTGAELCRVRLGRPLGAGGFGRVYEGELEGAGWRRDRRVAVKVPRSGGGESLTDSFLAESALLRLRHPNVVSVLAVGWTRAQLDDCGRSTDKRCDDVIVTMIPAIVMEFAGHRSLQSVIDNSTQTPSLGRRLNYAHDVTAALSYIHRRRLVHLDVKPANIIVTDSDRCKLTDFGCSQRLPSTPFDDDEAVSSVERSTVVQRPPISPRRPSSPTFNGTFAYRAPELFRGGAVSPAADVYSFGVTLWQLRSLASPYAGREWHAVVFAVVAYHDRPDTSPALRRRRSAARRLPSAVNDVARTPDRRYRNVFRSCWDANPDARPSVAELVRLFKTWRTELESVSSASSLETDDLDDI